MSRAWPSKDTDLLQQKTWIRMDAHGITAYGIRSSSLRKETMSQTLSRPDALYFEDYSD
jgi:hypothetical protein